jgi:hypothetical protein
VEKIDHQDDNEVRVVASMGPASSDAGDVVLVTNTGSKITRLNGWVYVAKPEVLTITPSRGQLGTLVSIVGSNLLGGGISVEEVSLAGIPVKSISSSSDSLLVVSAGASTTKSGQILARSDTGTFIQSDFSWNYIEASDIFQVLPTRGSEGTLVTIRGTNLRANGSKVDSVFLAGVRASIANESDSEVVVRATYSEAKIGDVKVVSNTGGYSFRTNEWTYLEPGEITSFKPSEGQKGTLVTISGQAMYGGGSKISEVSFGSLRLILSINLKMR